MSDKNTAKIDGIDVEIKDEKTILERAPLEKVAVMNELNAYKHNDFWHCMDTKRDKTVLDNLWNTKNANWAINWAN